MQKVIRLVVGKKNEWWSRNYWKEIVTDLPEHASFFSLASKHQAWLVLPFAFPCLLAPFVDIWQKKKKQWNSKSSMQEMNHTYPPFSSPLVCQQVSGPHRLVHPYNACQSRNDQLGGRGWSSTMFFSFERTIRLVKRRQTLLYSYWASNASFSAIKKSEKRLGWERQKIELVCRLELQRNMVDR